MKSANQGLPPAGFTVPRDALAAALAFVVRGAPLRPSVPVLAGVVFHTTCDGAVTVSTFDYETARAVQLDGTSVQAAPGMLIVPCRALHDWVKKLPRNTRGTKTRPAVVAPDVVVTATAERATFTAGDATYRVDTFPTDDYPSPPDIGDTAGVIDGAVFADAVRRTVAAAGTNTTLPVLMGVHVYTDGPVLHLDATDRYRLGAADIPWQAAGEGDWLIPALELAEVGKLVGKTGPVHIVHGAGSDRTVALTWGDGAYRLVTRLIDGDYPKMRTLIPDNCAYTTVVNGAALADAVGRVAVALDRLDPVYLAFDPATPHAVYVQAGRDTSAETAREPVSAAWDYPDPFTVAFNHTYLTAALSAVGTPQVRLSLNDPRKPGVLDPVDAAGDVIPGYRHLLTSVRPAETAPEPVAKATTPEPVAEPEPEPVADDAAADVAAWEARRAADADAYTPAPQPVADVPPARPARKARKPRAVAVVAPEPVAAVVAEPVAEVAAEPVADPDPVADTGKVITIVNTPEHGTIIKGSAFGDGVSDIIGKRGLGVAWAPKLRHFYLADRDADQPDTERAETVAAALRAGGFRVAMGDLSVPVPYADVTGAPAPAPVSVPGPVDPWEPASPATPAPDGAGVVVVPHAAEPVQVGPVGWTLPAPARADDGGWVLGAYATTDGANMKHAAYGLRVLINAMVVGPLTKGVPVDDRLRVSVYRRPGRLVVTAYVAPAGQCVDLPAVQAAVADVAGRVDGIAAPVTA